MKQWRRRGRRGSSSSRYSYKQQFALNFFPMVWYTLTISKITIQMDFLRINLTIPTTSREPSLNTGGFALPFWSTTIWKLLQRRLSFLPDKTSLFNETFSTMLEFVE